MHCEKAEAGVVAQGGAVAERAGMGGYHWGITRKRAILGWEAGLTGQAEEAVAG